MDATTHLHERRLADALAELQPNPLDAAAMQPHADRLAFTDPKRWPVISALALLVRILYLYPTGTAQPSGEKRLLSPTPLVSQWGRRPDGQGFDYRHQSSLCRVD